MDTLSHFILALLAGLAMGLHRRHKVTYIAAISFLAVLIDLDHFLVPLGIGTVYRSMHNVYITMIAPFSLFLAAYYLERKNESDRYQTFFLLLTVMLTGHLIADMIFGPVMIFYPLSYMSISVPNIDIQATSKFASQIVGPYGIGMTAYAIVIFIGAMIHDTLFHMKRKTMRPHEALMHSLRDFF